MDTSQSFKYRITQWLFQNILSRKRRLFITTTFLKLLRKSDIQRWLNYENLYENWEERTEFMAHWIPTETSVLEFGCGNMALKKYLPDGCQYKPSDIVRRDQETLVIDLNQNSPLSLPQHDVFFLSGVLEYVYDVEQFVKLSSQVCNLLIASYVACETKTVSTLAYRRSNGWVNDYSKVEFLNLLQNNGFKLLEEKVWKNQLIFCFHRNGTTSPCQSTSNSNSI